MKEANSKRCNRLGAGLALFLLAGFADAADRSTQTTAEAFDLESGELLYREVHCVNADVSEREVFYQGKDGELLARKLVDYRPGTTTPSFEQQNFYSSETIRVGLEQGKVKMEIVDTASLEPRSAVAVQPGAGLPVVIDAGFDAFVREHWDELVAGDNREFQFPFADRESLVELRIGRLGCSYDSLTDQCFRLDLANWFLRMVVAPIELGYDPDSRRLVRYRGLSNIGDANGNGLIVDLRYDYRNIPRDACAVIEQKLANDSTTMPYGRLAINN